MLNVLIMKQLFAGKPTLKKLALWTDDATFNDPLTKSAGRKQFSAQWYGLATAFSEIVSLSSFPFFVCSSAFKRPFNFNTQGAPLSFRSYT